MFFVSSVLTQIDFNLLWRYFSWSNQTLAMITLWMASVYLLHEGKKRLGILLTVIPASFMSAVSVTYILMAPEGFRLSSAIAYPIGVGVALILLVMFLLDCARYAKKQLNIE